ncbi:MAG TPA: hypothetical protein VKY31_05480, partial [Terriglobia bacterium]|nr:hypothetical protein [Terriglobia bacterium]
MQARTRLFLLITCLLIGTIEGNPQTPQSLPTISIPVYLVNGVSGNITIAAQTIGGSFTVAPSGDPATTVLTNGQYQVRWSQNTGTSHTILHVELDSLSSQPVQINEIAMQLRFPRANVYGVWSPALPANQAQVIAATAGTAVAGGSDPNYGVPYIATASQTGQTVAGVGLLRQDTNVHVYGYPAGLNEYGLRLWIPETRVGSTVSEDFYISTDSTQTWFDTAQDYSDWVDSTNGYQPFPVNS